MFFTSLTLAIVPAAGGAGIRCVAAACPPAAPPGWSRAPGGEHPAPVSQRRVCKGSAPPRSRAIVTWCRCFWARGPAGTSRVCQSSVLELLQPPSHQPLSSGLPLGARGGGACQEVTPQGVPIQFGMGSGPPGDFAHLRGARSCHLTLSPGAALTEPPPREQHRRTCPGCPGRQGESTGTHQLPGGCRPWGAAVGCRLWGSGHGIQAVGCRL